MPGSASADFDHTELTDAANEREKQDLRSLIQHFIINSNPTKIKPGVGSDYNRLQTLKDKHKDYIIQNRTKLLGNLDTSNAQSFLNSLDSKWRDVREIAGGRSRKNKRKRKRKSKRKSKRNF